MWPNATASRYRRHRAQCSITTELGNVTGKFIVLGYKRSNTGLMVLELFAGEVSLFQDVPDDAIGPPSREREKSDYEESVHAD